MNVLPRVCIMIPTYNQANFIGKAVESALAQDYPNIEIVIADDCSTDNTSAVLQSFLNDAKIKYERNSTNIGRVANYRKCLYEYTVADWVINLDGDDYYTNDQYISQAMQAIQKNDIDKTLFYQGVHILKSDRIEKWSEPNIKSSEVVLSADDYFLKYFERNYFSHMSTLYHRPIAIASDFYSQDIISSDIFSVLLLCINNRDKYGIVSKNVSGVWYQHTGNSSKTIDPQKHLTNLLLYVKLYRLAKLNGYGKWQMLNWLAKATFIYIRSYFYTIITSKSYR